MTSSGGSKESLETLLRRACRAEVLHHKPGNVTPDCSFSNTTADDFLKSADVVAPVLATAGEVGVGTAILRSVQATIDHVGQNTNLGIILLLAPLAAVPSSVPLADGIEDVLQSLTVEDAEQVYRAIAAASPGGLGEASEQDVSETPTETLRECMALAADRDMIAAQYANGFRDVLSEGLDLLAETISWTSHHEQRIAWLATSLISHHGDSLIARKNGVGLSEEAKRRALGVVDSGWPFSAGGDETYNDFDSWLRDDDHRRNPGTTADLVAAIMFAAQRSGICEIEDESGVLLFPLGGR